MNIRPSRFSKTWACARAFGLLIAVIATGGVLAVRQISHRRLDAREFACRGLLAQIGLAIQNYRDDNGSFPPICVRNREGKPLHSWRVLLLPYLGFEDISKRYDFSEAWNSPKNSALANEVSERVARVFRCPNDEAKQGSWCTFLALTTNDSRKSERLMVMEESPFELIPIIIEIHESGVQWMEPRDFPVELAKNGLVRRNPESSVVNFLTSEGRVWSLTDNQLTFNNSESEIARRLIEKWLAANRTKFD